MTGEPRPLQINVRRLRAARGMTLAQLADEVGISISHLSQVERGVKSINSRLLAKLAEALEVPPSALVGATVESNFVTSEESSSSAGTTTEHPFVTRLREWIGSDPEITPSGLAKRAGLNARAVHDLLEGRAACPRLDSAERVCSALGTTLSEFLSKGISPGSAGILGDEQAAAPRGSLPVDEEKLLSMFRRLTADEKAALLRHVRGHFTFE